MLELTDLLDEFDRAMAWTDRLTSDVSEAHLIWRPHENSSAIGWHLGHQAAVGHMLSRNLMFAEPLLDPELDRIFDSATPEPYRGTLPDRATISDYRARSADFVRRTVERIDAGEVGAPAQLRSIAAGVLTATINHEYQHDAWIAEVRAELGYSPSERPHSDRLVDVDGYWLLTA